MVRLYKVEGLSGSEIARRAGVTRNTVLGRMFRAGAMKGRHPRKQKDPPPKKTCRPPQAAAVFEGRPGVASGPTRPLVDFYASGAEALRDMRARARS